MKISYIVATLNSEKYITDCLNSILVNGANYLGEVIVIDGGSTDSTESICTNLLGGINYKFIRQKSSGLYPALNEAVIIASEKHIMFVHSDDILLSLFVDQELISKVDVLVGDVQFMDNNLVGTFKREMPIFPKKYLWNFPFIFHPNALYPRWLLEKYTFNDLEFGRKADMYQLAEMSGECNFVRTSAIVYGYRIHDNSITMKGIRTGKESPWYWFWRMYVFVFFENSRLSRVIKRLRGEKTWT